MPFDSDTAWSYLQVGHIDKAHSLLKDFQLELRNMEQEGESTHGTGKAGALSVFGYYRAMVDKEIEEGVALCQRAILRQGDLPIVYEIYASLLKELGFHADAISQTRKGLQFCPKDPSLTVLLRTLERRRPPVIPFLSRNALINRWLGKWRYRLTRWRHGST
jgi:hypothetical protein